MRISDDELIVIIFFFCASFFIGGILGYNVGNAAGWSTATKETMNFCVEKPKECKVKYEFYKLEQQK